MKKAIPLIYGILSLLSLCFTAKVQGQCDLHNSIDVTGHRLKSHLTLLSYQWVKCPGYTPIPGSVAQTFDVYVDGEYALIGTLDTCTDTTECVSITGLGIGNTMVPDKINIFPNPIKDGRINISGKYLQSAAAIQVRDVLGQVKWARIVPFDQGNAQLNLELPPGVYLISVDDQHSYRKQMKIIID